MNGAALALLFYGSTLLPGYPTMTAVVVFLRGGLFVMKDVWHLLRRSQPDAFL